MRPDGVRELGRVWSRAGEGLREQAVALGSPSLTAESFGSHYVEDGAGIGLAFERIAGVWSRWHEHWGHCEKTGVNLFDTSTGAKTTIGAPGGTPQAGDYRVTRAWWGRSGTLYATFQQGPCVPVVPGEHSQQPPPTVWRYQDGQWSPLPTSGPAIQALDLGEGRFAVIQPAPPKPIGYATQYDLTRGSLVVLDGQGGQTHIADDVTALAELPPSGQG